MGPMWNRFQLAYWRQLHYCFRARMPSGRPPQIRGGGKHQIHVIFVFLGFLCIFDARKRAANSYRSIAVSSQRLALPDLCRMLLPGFGEAITLADASAMEAILGRPGLRKDRIYKIFDCVRAPCCPC